MKTILILLLSLLVSCGGHGIKNVCEEKTVESKYSSYEKVGEALKAQSQGLSSETIYIVFAADYCPACRKLFQVLKKAGLEKKVLFVDIEKTWGFLFSREMSVDNIPALAVVNSNKTIQIKEGLHEVYKHLLSHAGKKRNIELIQGDM